ncbi:MAG: hypothetical protein QMC94_00290 [Anaerosomatales bacterium]|nr:hypothetical protein [Anaerosomatales bacterium]
MSIGIMQWRLQELVATYRGLLETGVPLVASDSGKLHAAGFTDDPGLYALVPALARLLHVPVEQAYTIFVVGAITLSVVVGLAGFLRLVRRPLARAYATAVALVLAYGSLRIADVYTVCFVVPFALAPWVLASTHDRSMPRGFFPLMAVLGILGAASHLIRSQSATSTVLFTALIVWLWIRADWKRKAAAFTLLAVTGALVLGGFAALIDRRDAYLVANQPGYAPARVGHPLWHNTYIGLAYLPNPYVSAWSDEVAAKKAQEIAPGAPYVSEAYEAALRSEVLRIVREDPLFVLRTVAAKLLVEVLRGLLLFGMGLIAILRRKPPRPLLAAFAVAIAFETLPALLTMPFHAYMLGFYTWVALFSTVCVATATQHDLWPLDGTPTGPQARS